MNSIDVLVLVAVVAVALLCWAEGLVRAVWAYSGLMLGTALGLVVAPAVLSRFELSIWSALAALVIVAACALGARDLALALERRVRPRVLAHVPWEPRRTWDRIGGAVFGVVVALGVSWMIGLTLASSSIESIASAANRSTILQALNRVPLPISSALVREFSELGQTSDFPRYVDIFTATRVVDVPPPDERVSAEVGVLRSASSVWRILAQGSVVTEQGSGFLVAPERVLTAAHVVGGARRITVELPSGSAEATVVVCDPEQDLAVLAVPGATGRILSFTDARQGRRAAVVGYPENGPLTLTPARIRDRGPWQSSDIWGRGRYQHDAYSVRADIRSGDSGGPLVTPQGQVLGVVVAASRVDADTGYALSRETVAPVLARATAAGSDPAPQACGRS